jgi:hypothetical protein
MCALVRRIAALLDIIACPPTLYRGPAAVRFVVLVSSVVTAIASGCAKGQDISEDNLVFLDPRLPTTQMDASAEGGLEPPVEVPVEMPPDAGSPRPDATTPVPDSGSPEAPADAGSDAGAPADGG